MELLRLFGAAQTTDRQANFERRIEVLFTTVERELGNGRKTWRDVRPVLEYVASRYPYAWVMIADLIEQGAFASGIHEIELCLLKYIELPGDERLPIPYVWKRIADLRRGVGDTNGELHALSQICRQSGVSIEMASNAAGRINGVLRIRPRDLTGDEKRAILLDAATSMEKRVSELDATDCSRLAWLYMHLDQLAKAAEFARRGLEMDPSNAHCAGILARLPDQ